MAESAKPRKPGIAAPVAQLDLDAEIARAERAVIERDRRIRQRADALVVHVRHEAIKHAGGGALLGLGTVALTWWLKRLARRNAPPPTAAPAPEPPSSAEHLLRDTGLTLAGLLPMLWPLLPRNWRRSISPNTAATVLTFVAPWLGRLLRRKPRRAPAG